MEKKEYPFWDKLAPPGMTNQLIIEDKFKSVVLYAGTKVDVDGKNKIYVVLAEDNKGLAEDFFRKVRKEIFNE